MAHGTAPHRGFGTLDPVERAIRSALDKGDAADAAFRLRVYRAAQGALDRALADGAVTDEQRHARRSRLSAVVATIEAEFQPAVETVAPQLPPQGERDFAEQRRAEPSPTLDGEQRPRPRPVEAPEEARPRRRVGAAFARLFVGVTLLALVALGAWWAYDTGLFMSAAERDTSVPNPPVASEGEDFSPKEPGAPEKPGESDAARDWITVFTPRDPSTVQAPAGTAAEVVGSGDTQALRIASSSADAAVTFDVGEGVLEKLAGAKAVFNVVARAKEGEPTQMSITCQFSDFGDCGRKRYEVANERGEYLFEVAFPHKKPGGGGTISIVSDVTNGGKPVDILQIRAAPAVAD